MKKRGLSGECPLPCHDDIEICRRLILYMGDRRNVGDCNQETLFILVGISQKYLSILKACNAMNFPGGATLSLNAGFTIDL